MNIAIVDYGMGNIKSLYSAFKYLNCHNVSITSNEAKLTQADKIILPGVGTFNKAMQLIKDQNLDLLLHDLVVNKEKPIFGICLGMQLMGLSSNENGFNKGLGLIDGVVDSFNKEQNIAIPHIGYNQVSTNLESTLYNNMDEVLDFYFVHSYKMTSTADIGQSTCHYGNNFIASFEKDNIFGTQFHPELSQQNGLKVLKNFIELF